MKILAVLTISVMLPIWCGCTVNMYAVAVSPNSGAMAQTAGSSIAQSDLMATANDNASTATVKRSHPAIESLGAAALGAIGGYLIK